MALRVPTDPIALLTPDLSRDEPFINSFWGPTICGSLAFAAVCFGNFATKRPMLSGLPKHASFTAIGLFVGKYVEGMRGDYLAERDAVLRHYVTLHPDDFPAIERKKFADVLDSWVPIR